MQKYKDLRSGEGSRFVNAIESKTTIFAVLGWIIFAGGIVAKQYWAIVITFSLLIISVFCRYKQFSSIESKLGERSNREIFDSIYKSMDKLSLDEAKYNFDDMKSWEELVDEGVWKIQSDTYDLPEIRFADEAPDWATTIRHTVLIERRNDIIAVPEAKIFEEIRQELYRRFFTSIVRLGEKFSLCIVHFSGKEQPDMAIVRQYPGDEKEGYKKKLTFFVMNFSAEGDVVTRQITGVTYSAVGQCRFEHSCHSLYNFIIVHANKTSHDYVADAHNEGKVQQQRGSSLADFDTIRDEAWQRLSSEEA